MYQTQPKILVTGGAGFIGSHAVLALKQAGYDVIILDNLIYGHRDIVENELQVEMIIGDIRDRNLLNRLFKTHQIDAVMHFAAYAYVGESVFDPNKYYDNNVVGTLTLLDAMLRASVKKIVFSSTCAIYGVPQDLPICEDSPHNPINPYGASKLTVERILSDFHAAYELNSVCLRYFNAAGASPTGYLGEDHTPETHLIPLVLLTALGKHEFVPIFGTDYLTSDGTCIRDYIHVCDLASAHVLALEYLLQGGKIEVFNLGNGNGFSIKEIINTATAVTGHTIKTVDYARRPGDPPILVGSAEKAKRILGWHPQYPNLKEIVAHAWQWHQRRQGSSFLTKLPNPTKHYERSYAALAQQVGR
ncbi:MAG TPA: UDP-glucose 4-epimerase GalE [Cyanobacteria bacterium UBA8803]|nr:UDP-glucose 4-epimerase GalE [Cyanobacteria bacterium UBA9273]HBL58443.1 UDP-glucose 4-epimerase GalE [Cyanobacteria bacterium UBA8803]